jgi:hypothetical protein
MSEAVLRSPYPYFGGKRKVAPIVWRAFGDVPNYVEPFFGSGAVLLGRPQIGKIETINDINAHVSNFWRAVRAEPDAVARYADGAVNEADLHARHAWLVAGAPAHRERMLSEPDYFDAKIAGWWVWGLCAWIGHGWCEPGRKASRQIPVLSVVNSGGGNGVHASSARLPALGHSGRGSHSPEAGPLADWFGDLQTRLSRVRVACGDWTRVISGAVTGATNTRENMGMIPCGVFLDPPYEGEEGVYVDGGAVAGAVREWALANGDSPRLRIALCGYEGASMPSTWREHAWKAAGGYGNRNGGEANENARRERVWLSPHCLPLEDVQVGLFGASR